MIILSILGKFGAVFTLIPKPVIGGMFWCLFGLIVAVGLSSLQYVNLNDSRNLFVLGFSFFNGMVVPSWISANPQAIDSKLNTLSKSSFFNSFTVHQPNFVHSGTIFSAAGSFDSGPNSKIWHAEKIEL